MLEERLTLQDESTFGANLEFKVVDGGDGFYAPELPKDVKQKVYSACQEIFGGKNPVFIGCGGSIPFMEVFAQNFPQANFLLTGAAFADGNIHSANENLRLSYCENLTCFIGLLLSKL